MNMERDKNEILVKLYQISNSDSMKFRKKTTSNICKSILHKVYDENVLIHDIVSIPEYENRQDSNLYYSIACPNFSCNFIFDHPLDHYPFMLLIELARQISIGVTHKFKDIPVGKIKNSVSGFDLKLYKGDRTECSKKKK